MVLWKHMFQMQIFYKTEDMYGSTEHGLGIFVVFECICIILNHLLSKENKILVYPNLVNSVR